MSNDNEKKRPDIKSELYTAWSVPSAFLWSNSRPEAPAKTGDVSPAKNPQAPRHTPD